MAFGERPPELAAILPKSTDDAYTGNGDTPVHVVGHARPRSALTLMGTQGLSRTHVLAGVRTRHANERALRIKRWVIRPGPAPCCPPGFLSTVWQSRPPHREPSEYSAPHHPGY